MEIGKTVRKGRYSGTDSHPWRKRTESLSWLNTGSINQKLLLLCSAEMLNLELLNVFPSLSLKFKVFTLDSLDLLEDFFLSFCYFFGPLPQHMEVPRLGVESEL